MSEHREYRHYKHLYLNLMRGGDAYWKGQSAPSSTIRTGVGKELFDLIEKADTTQRRSGEGVILQHFGYTTDDKDHVKNVYTCFKNLFDGALLGTAKAYYDNSSDEAIEYESDFKYVLDAFCRLFLQETEALQSSIIRPSDVDGNPIPTHKRLTADITVPATEEGLGIICDRSDNYMYFGEITSEGKKKGQGILVKGRVDRSLKQPYGQLFRGNVYMGEFDDAKANAKTHDKFIGEGTLVTEFGKVFKGTWSWNSDPPLVKVQVKEGYIPSYKGLAEFVARVDMKRIKRRDEIMYWDVVPLSQ